MRNALAPSRIAWGAAAGCAFLLLFGPLGGRTAWVGREGGTSGEAAGYEWVVLLAGALAVVALLLGRPSRPGMAGTAAAALVACAAFGMAAWSAGSYALALARLGFPFGRARLLPGGEIVIAAAGPPVFAAIAAVGLACCVGLVFAWSKSAREAL